MNIRAVSKAVAGAVAAGATGAITPAVMIPPNVETPWYGYIIAGLVSAAIGFVGVYLAPRNRPPS